MRLRQPKWAALAGVVLAAGLLASCGEGLSAGQLKGGTGNEFCAPALNRHQIFTVGSMGLIENPGPPSVIDRFGLFHLRGLRLLDAWEVPVTGARNLNDPPGDWDGFPPMRRPGGAMQWGQRRPIDGARVPRTFAIAGPRQLYSVDLVFVVKLVGRTGGFDAIDVYYHNANGHYHLHITNGIGLAVPKDYRPYCHVSG